MNRRRRLRGNQTTFLDTFANKYGVVMALVVLLLLLVNPPAKKAEGEPPPGSMSVYSVWPEGPTDVDQWFRDPSGEIVGFSAKTGTNSSLLKDDLGSSNDLVGTGNFENTYVRNLMPGRYTVNLHCYTCPSLPVSVVVEVRISKPGQDSVLLFRRSVTLMQAKQEITVADFAIDRNGDLVPGSVHSVYTPLYHQGKPS